MTELFSENTLVKTFFNITHFNVKMHPLPFKSPIFSEILVTKKIQTRFCRREPVEKEQQKIDLYSIFPFPFPFFKGGIFY